MSETEITPQSVNAPQADSGVSTYRVLRRYDDDETGWNELGVLTSKHTPTASEIGEAYGTGDYLLIERNSKYSFRNTYEMRVVADRVYRLAGEDA